MSEFKKWILKPSNKISLFAIIISTLGFVFSVYYNRQSLNIAQKHNELSVKPMLHINCAVDRTEGFLRLYLTNKGLGPATITQLDYKYKSKHYSNYWDFFNLIKNMMAKDSIKIIYNHTQIFENSVISSNEEIQLAKIFVEPIIYADSVEKILDNCSIILKCRDIYENNFDYKIDL